MKPTLCPGLDATLSYQVPEERTVPHLLPESGEFAAMPRVLATGYLIGLVEWTCMRAVAGHLEPGERSLGVHVDLSHEAPTPAGSTVTIEATLSAVEGRGLTFDVLARDDVAVVCRGRHRRAIVDLERFNATIATRASRDAAAP